VHLRDGLIQRIETQNQSELLSTTEQPVAAEVTQ